jgi:integrase
MPRPKSTAPAYQFHISGQARVTLAGVDYYLGSHGTPESYARYYALLAEYNANGRQAPAKETAQAVRQADLPIRVRDITADFRNRVLPRYEHSPGHYGCFKNLCDKLDQRHGDEPASDFGPRKLESIRDALVASGNCRKYANEQIGKIVQIFNHGVARELVSADRIVALRALEPLKPGQARDNKPRTGVPLDAVQKTLPHLTPTAAAMAELQLLTAMRPSELFSMRPSDIDRSGDVWFYRPAKHKTAHHGKTKSIPIVGDAVRVLSPFLFGDQDQLCFMTTKGTAWNKDSYRVAVTRAAKAAKAPHWTPYALRHAAAQAVRDAVGIEAAAALLGHSRLSTTETYSKASEARAVEAARHAPRLSAANA